MNVCRDCRERIAGPEPVSEWPFPAWPVAAGALGALAAAVTGAVLLVPAALVAGVLTSVRPRRCDLCEAAIDAADGSFQLLQDTSDQEGRRIFESLSPPEESGVENRDRFAPSTDRGRTALDDPAPPWYGDPVQEADDPGASQAYVYDESLGTLVADETAAPAAFSFFESIADGNADGWGAGDFDVSGFDGFGDGSGGDA